MSRASDLREQKIANRTPFPATGSAMSAVEGRVWSYGYMSEEHSEVYRKAADAGLIAYTILSYATPLAWILVDGRKVMPENGCLYSMITKTKHAPGVRRAFNWEYDNA